MPSVSFRLDKRADGQYAVRLRITHQHTSSIVVTGVNVLLENWDKDRTPHVNRTDKLARQKNELLETFSRRAEAAIYDLTRDEKLDGVTAFDIKEYAFPKKKKKVVSHGVLRSTFLDALDRKTDQSEPKSMQTYIYTYRKIQEFMKKSGRKSCNFEDVDFSFISDFDKWMTAEGMHMSSRGIIMRNIRVVWNIGINEGIASADNYPFRRFHIKRAARREVEFVPIEMLQRFLELDLSTQQGIATLQKARDIAMISLCLCGANLKDIYNMPPTALRNGEIVFVRGKIAHCEPTPTHIAVEPELQELIDKYRGSKHLFCFADQCKSFSTFQRKVTERLKRLSAFTGCKINMALLRHTWATYACKLEVDEFVISKSLGHTDTDVTARYYIGYDWGRTANANRMVLKYITRGIVPGRVHIPAMLSSL